MYDDALAAAGVSALLHRRALTMQLPPVDRSTPAWRPAPAADLYSTGAGGAVPVRPVQAANPVESTDRLGEGLSLRESAVPDLGRVRDPDNEHRDWTLAEPQKEQPQEPEPPPRDPPLYKELLEFIQSMWRASGSAVELAQEINKTTLTERLAQQVKNDEPLTYADPKIKRSGGG
ncbi:hypothetical protein SAMN05428957_10414 [Oryzisolibacter propanilivorax]|uniref:Uncharacterized protein n=2 Tax=Oryzisolibacter propanilivorax TaxID=1527607 RepID=A0A1G9RZV1_9BURK|nr:hypothetical protein SAMN05428957_10414 [Oryzisolibacter propanilivorax]